MVTRDPLDIGEPEKKAWEEFRAGFAAAFLQVWLLDELDEIAPNYFRELDSRFAHGFISAEQLAHDDPEYDGAVPLQGPANEGVWFIDQDEASQIYDQLFPHGLDPAEDRSAAYGLCIVGLHAALESYARAIGVNTKGNLPSNILRHLRGMNPSRDLDAWTADQLTECDETRHIVVHNRGVVDERYANAVKGNRLIPGERKRLNFNLTMVFAKAVWQAASALDRRRSA